MAQKLGERLGQPGVVENRPGAGGNIGNAAAAAAAPDGYTLLFTVAGIVTNPFFYQGSVDPLAELAPVIQLSTAPLVLLAAPSLPAASVAEIVAAARAQPGAVSCAIAGALPQVSCELLRAHARADMLMVPYKGNAQALVSLLAGEVSLVFDLPNTALGPAKSGRARAIATTAARRGRGPFGELPLVAETIPEFEIAVWQGAMAPKATPRELVARLNRELNAVLADPELRRRFAEWGLEPAGGTPEAFGELVRRDLEKYRKVLTEAGVRPE